MWVGLYISGDCIPWLSVMYIEWVARAKLASVCLVTEAPKMSVLTVSLSLPIDADSMLPHELGGWRPGDWITLMIQMSSFLIQRITYSGGGAGGEFSECSWSRSSQPQLSLEPLELRPESVWDDPLQNTNPRPPVSRWHQIWLGAETIFISWITD